MSASALLERSLGTYSSNALLELSSRILSSSDFLECFLLKCSLARQIGMLSCNARDGETVCSRQFHTCTHQWRSCLVFDSSEPFVSRQFHTSIQNWALACLSEFRSDRKCSLVLDTQSGRLSVPAGTLVVSCCSLSTLHRLLSLIFCLLSAVYYPLFTVYWSTVYCLSAWNKSVTGHPPT